MSNYPVGIYLGPNDCSIATWKNRTVEIIDIHGARTTPFVVSFIKSDRLVGIIAKIKEKENPKNTVYCIREIIGRKFDAPDVQKFIKKVPFKIEKDSKTGKPKIIVEYKGEIKSYFLEEIYSMIIQKLIQNASDFI